MSEDSPLSALREHEIKALRLLTAAALGPTLVDALIRDAELIQVDYLDNGYRLELSYPQLRREPAVFDSPVVRVSLDDIAVRVTVQIDGDRVKIHCRSDHGSVPAHFRNRELTVRIDDAAE